MNREQFLKFINAEFTKICETQKVKGRDYSGDEDVLFNFKRSAQRGGLTPLQVWSVLAGKHWDAIMSYIESGGESQSEPIEGRLHDLEVYCFLLQAHLFEENEKLKGVPYRRGAWVHYDIGDDSTCINYNTTCGDTITLRRGEVTCTACRNWIEKHPITDFTEEGGGVTTIPPMSFADQVNAPNIRGWSERWHFRGYDLFHKANKFVCVACGIVVSVPETQGPGFCPNETCVNHGHD